jgi:thiol-disulfide isomerase/thioredoxin
VPGIGLAPGTVAPLATAVRVDGQPFKRDSTRRLLVLFTTPGCGPCGELLPEVAQWQRDHRDRLEIVVAVGAPAEEADAEARRHGLGEAIADEGAALADAFGAHATPSAILIEVDDTIGSWVAAGPEPIRQLVSTAVRPPPVTVGEPLPAVEVPTLEGDLFSFADLRGRTSALLFWNPGCGFCRQMHPQLRLWEAGVNGAGPALVIVSSGDREATAAERFASPVLLDAEQRLAGALGAHGTPMAVLVGPDGRVASPVAAGATGVMELLTPVAVP